MALPRPTRPVGVILSAIALGLLAAFLLLTSLVTFIGLATGHTRAALAAGAPASAAGLATGMMLVMSLLYLGVAVWSIATLVGLIRMRTWARVSAMVIAGCIALFSLLGALGMLAAQSLLNSGQVPVPPNMDSAMFHRMFAFAGLLCFLVAVLGIVVIVYFARRRTRDAFTFFNAPPQPYGQYPGVDPTAYPGAYASAPAWPAAPPQSPARDALTDFTVARPLPPSPNPPQSTPEDPHTDA